MYLSISSYLVFSLTQTPTIEHPLQPCGAGFLLRSKKLQGMHSLYRFSKGPKIASSLFRRMETMGLLKLCFLSCLLVLLTLLSFRAGAEDAPSAPSSQCVRCHTDVKGLIRLGWEIEKIRGKPAVSDETVGEG